MKLPSTYFFIDNYGGLWFTAILPFFSCNKVAKDVSPLTKLMLRMEFNKDRVCVLYIGEELL